MQHVYISIEKEILSSQSPEITPRKRKVKHSGYYTKQLIANDYMSCSSCTSLQGSHPSFQLRKKMN